MDQLARVNAVELHLDEPPSSLLHPGVLQNGEGMLIEGRRIDGAQVRSLFEEVAGDLHAYLGGLLRLVAG